MFNRNYSAIILLVLSVIVFSCGGEKTTEENNQQKPVLEEKILSDIVIDEDLGISYQVPLQWELMSAELSERYVARMNSEKFDGNFIVYQPKAFYFNSSISGLLRVGSVIKNEESSELELTIDHYITLFQKFNSIKNFERKKIQTNNLVITQLIIEKSNLISFKNIFMNRQNKIIQFDFSLQKKDFEKEKDKISSSLASIKLL